MSERADTEPVSPATATGGLGRDAHGVGHRHLLLFAGCAGHRQAPGCFLQPRRAVESPWCSRRGRGFHPAEEQGPLGRAGEQKDPCVFSRRANIFISVGCGLGTPWTRRGCWCFSEEPYRAGCVCLSPPWAKPDKDRTSQPSQPQEHAARAAETRFGERKEAAGRLSDPHTPWVTCARFCFGSSSKGVSRSETRSG